MHAEVDGSTPARPVRPVCPIPTDLENASVHMIGIGGAGMSGAAALLRNLGARVSGSDLTPFEGMGKMLHSGIHVSIGHAKTQVPTDARLVVISAAIPQANPELVEARERGIPIVKYAELLGGLMRIREGVAISGTHGKSTTSGMCVHLFQQGGLSPSFVIGASSAQLGGSSGAGSGSHLIVESCEFDRSFLKFRPKFAAILNIEPDHLDCYRDLDDIAEAFAAFAGNVAADGLLVCNADDPRTAAAALASRARVETFGFCESADWRACNLRCDRGRFSFDVRYRDRLAVSTSLAIPGRYNVSNALAAIALACEAGVRPEDVAGALPTFLGVDRRLTLRGAARGVTILDDYAHHPTEIRVTIEAARARYEPKRMWVVFQPHQHARTRHFMSQFAESFIGIEEIIVPDVYGAREQAQADADSPELVRRICGNGQRARYLSRLESVAPYLIERVGEGDVILIMGAGDVWKVADELVERFCGSDRVRCPAGPADVVPAGGRRTISVPAA